MEGFNGILDIGWVEDLQMMKDKLIDEKKNRFRRSRFKGK